MMITFSEFIKTIMNTKMLFITQIDQAIIGTPAVCMNYAAHVHATPNYANRVFFFVSDTISVYT